MEILSIKYLIESRQRRGKMKIDVLKFYIAQFILLAILSFALFVSNSVGRIELAIILVLYTIIINFWIKKRNLISNNKKQIIILMTIFAFIYLAIFYLMGLYFGYYKSTTIFSLWTIRKYILPISVIIITSEIIRSILLALETKESNILTFIIMVLIDVIIYRDIYDINSLEGVLVLIGFILFASMSCNLLYNYISKRYGYISIIIYRLITVLYVYFIPFVPDIYVFFRSVLRMLYPYFIYKILEYTYSKEEITKAYKDKKKNIFYETILVVLIIGIVMLVSCKFKYGILVIGSGSMKGTINKGDAIVFEKYDGKQDEIGQIVVFQKDDVKLVHRIVDIKNINGEKRFYTKGDANQKIDDGYITDKQIIGVSKFKILYIGYPSIWVREMFN